MQETNLHKEESYNIDFTKQLWTLKSWEKSAQGSGFPIQNLPYGVFQQGEDRHICSIIGDRIVDIHALTKMGAFNGVIDNTKVLLKKSLNDFMALGHSETGKVRNRLIEILNEEDKMDMCQNAHLFLLDKNDVSMIMPIKIGDYTDFYSSRDHATNVGCLFRDPENALMPNWLHLPVGYHGRASSVVVSDTDIIRPIGQTKAVDQEPILGPCRLLDFELEMSFIIGQSSALGHRVSTKNAMDHIFGLTLFNDWSARDIQKWEYVPLGPFLGKNFASTISPWIVPMDALQAFRVEGPKQDPEVLDYLKFEGKHHYDINLEVVIKTEEGIETVVSESNYKYMYWNMVQQLAHHTVNGCNIKTGDMYASGTISGPTDESMGSMLELSWAGSRLVLLNDGTERKFLKDGDTVIIRGYGEKDGIRIDMGEASGKILPAIPYEK